MQLTRSDRCFPVFEEDEEVPNETVTWAHATWARLARLGEGPSLDGRPVT